LYFPILSKIIAAFLGPLVTKPHPDDLPESFINLPAKIQHNFTKKGLINLAPEKLQSLVLSEQRQY
jgi:hypothetical protein